MTWKRWFLIFLVTALVCAALVVGFNWAVDPFGIFGDPFFDWYSYNMTQNPRVSKIAWLDRHWEGYDSYIIGSSKTSSFPAEYLNRAFGGARFYNMLMYGGDFSDIGNTVRYVLNNYRAENIIINMGFEELTRFGFFFDWTKSNMHAKVDGSSQLRFYAEYLFSHPQYAFDKLMALEYKTYMVNGNQTFVVETGAYNKSIRDIEPISDIGAYLAEYPKFLPWLKHWETMPEYRTVLASIAEIKTMCEEAGVGFTLVISPIFDGELDSFYNDDLMSFLTELAEITDYWDFSGYTPISADPRFFYDYAHFRNCVGAMMITRMYGGSLYVPDGFGEYVDAENVAARLARYRRDGEHDPREVEQRLPVLLYQDLVEGAASGSGSDSGASVSVSQFREHMAALKEAGFSAVSADQVRRFVLRGVPLPENPVLITFDGGYESAVTLGAPILREYGLRATTFIDGVSVGEVTHAGSGGSGIRHFTWEQAREARDVIEVQSQGYDVSREASREGALRMPGESESEYIEFFRGDFALAREGIERELGGDVFAYAFPLGRHRDLTRVLLSEMGVTMTFTRSEGVNTLVLGLPQSLLSLKRIAPGEGMTKAQLVELLQSHK